MKGLEPSTFCMANGCRPASQRSKYLQIKPIGRGATRRAPGFVSVFPGGSRRETVAASEGVWGPGLSTWGRDNQVVMPGRRPAFSMRTVAISASRREAVNYDTSTGTE